MGQDSRSILRKWTMHTYEEKTCKWWARRCRGRGFTIFKASASALGTLELCRERLFTGLAVPELLGKLRYSGIERDNL